MLLIFTAIIHSQKSYGFLTIEIKNLKMTIPFPGCPEEINKQNTKSCPELTIPAIAPYLSRGLFAVEGARKSQPPLSCSFIRS